MCCYFFVFQRSIDLVYTKWSIDVTIVDDTKDVNLIHACDDVISIVLSMFLTNFWDCCCFTTVPSPADQFTPSNVVRGNQKLCKWNPYGSSQP